MQKLINDKKLAFIYNVRHTYPDPENPSTFIEADFDDRKTIDLFIKHLRKIGFDVLPIESDTKAEKTLIHKKLEIEFALNYSEEILGSNPKIYMAEILERVGIPFSGCSNHTQKLIIDKGKMKEVLVKKNVSTLPFQIIKSESENLNSSIKFPLIIKPIARGSSAGITNKSVVNSVKEFHNQLKFVLNTFQESAIIEPYIDGREFSVGMLGNPPEIFPIIEPKHNLLPKNYYPIDSLEVKWNLEEELGEAYFDCPANVDNNLKSKIEGLCRSAWNALEIRDFCRIDLRMNEIENLYILDINSPPGLIPPEISKTSYFPMAAKVRGYNYRKLLYKIVEVGLSRFRNE